MISIFFILYKMLWMTTNIGFRLVCSTPSTIFIRPCTKWFPSFSFSTKCSESTNIGLSWSVLPHFHQTLYQWFPSFLFSTKCSEWQTNIGFRLVRSTHQPFSSDLVPSDFHFFSFSSKYSKREKNFLKKIRWKLLWKSWWAWNQLNFTREESSW